MATFDCYGTLIDWEGGVGSFLYELARRHEQDPPLARELRERWEALQFERIQGEWRSYREFNRMFRASARYAQEHPEEVFPAVGRESNLRLEERPGVVFTVEAGKIVQIDAYPTQAEALAAIGQ